MTPDELTRLRELHDAARPAPWYFNIFGQRAEIVDDEGYLVIEMGRPGTGNGNLVAEARNSLPALLEHIDRLTRRLGIYEARLGRVARNDPEAYAQALAGDAQ
ncbi:hypothetical protein [Rothia nasimurium]|uniref:hypothetical protein n=1 Tax=Rothia nasimurium TaxID=85336 RepID=UPI001F175F74|nr:hypothetical protein [Rothia nasimurium]